MEGSGYVKIWIRERSFIYKYLRLTLTRYEIYIRFIRRQHDELVRRIVLRRIRVSRLYDHVCPGKMIRYTRAQVFEARNSVLSNTGESTTRRSTLKPRNILMNGVEKRKRVRRANVAEWTFFSSSSSSSTTRLKKVCGQIILKKKDLISLSLSFEENRLNKYV